MTTKAIFRRGDLTDAVGRAFACKHVSLSGDAEGVVYKVFDARRADCLVRNASGVKLRHAQTALTVEVLSGDPEDLI